MRRDYEELGKPVDRTRWGMTPPTVNAYYSSQLAEIVFPAGILQPPFFDRSADEAVNFGGIGAVIGHELTHGFDDQGRKFDGKGNLTDWWTEADGKAFEQRASCVADQYSKYSPVKDPKTGEPVFLNGRLTLGENIGDNGGVRIAFMALMNTLEGKPRTGRLRLHARAALLPRLRAGVVPERHRRRIAPAHRHRPALGRRLPHERHREQHAGVREGVRLQAGLARWRRRIGAGCGRAAEASELTRQPGSLRVASEREIA